MRKTVSIGRAVILVLMPLLLTAVVLVGLYELQIVHGEAYYERSLNTIVSHETVPASRGSILDRNGRVLASNRVGYNVTVDRERLVAGGDPNGTLLTLVALADEAGAAHGDTLPISADPPFRWYAAMTEAQSAMLARYLEHFELAEDISATELMDWFRGHYSVDPGYSDTRARIAVGIRYELETRTLFEYSDYVFVTDADIDLISAVKERGLPGVSIETTSVREYLTDCAVHLLGRVGPMNSEEIELYRERGYPMNARVGKDGVERVFEQYLHGTDGLMTVTRDQNGSITDSVTLREPQAGANVTLTIDLSCQQTAEDSLARTISELNEGREADKLIKGGAVTVIQVGTGDVLASATYPTYDRETFATDYASLATDPMAPLYNRAVMGTYPPGSTFKMTTAIAALESGKITPETSIYDESVFSPYEGYEYRCWIAPGSHGMLTVATALQNSCNFFFYTVGLNTGIDTLSRYASLFGLGQSTGIELPESTGILANPEYKKTVVGEDWYVGDTVLASIGQSYNLFTPMQLASYTATIASGGDRYAAHLLRSVKSYDNSTQLEYYTPHVLSQVGADPENMAVVQYGMFLVSKYGSPSEILGSYPVDVASKTGTAQLGEGKENNAVFVAYAPYENPEIALAVVVEGGGSGASVVQIAKDVFDYWFTYRRADPAGYAENKLLK